MVSLFCKRVMNLEDDHRMNGSLMGATNYLTAGNAQVQLAQWRDRLGERPRPGFVLSPSDAVLLVVDVNNYFAHPDSDHYLPASAYAVQQIQRLVLAWRRMARPVLFTKHGHLADDRSVMSRFFNDVVHMESAEASLLSSLKTSSDQVIEKSTYDAFWGTNLHERLQAESAHQLVICGLLTDMCCETTARSAFCRNYEVYIPMDATASVNEERHVNSLQSMANCCARILVTQELIE